MRGNIGQGIMIIEKKLSPLLALPCLILSLSNPKKGKNEPKQHFTMPPPRFSEASLVKELEEKTNGYMHQVAETEKIIEKAKSIESDKGPEGDFDD